MKATQNTKAITHLGVLFSTQQSHVQLNSLDLQIILKTLQLWPIEIFKKYVNHGNLHTLEMSSAFHYKSPIAAEYIK